MKKCLKCDIPHEKKGNYCSRSCANSRTWSKEHKQKLSIANKKFANSLTDAERSDKFGHLKNEESYLKFKKCWNDKIMNTPFDELSYTGKKSRIIEEQNKKCNRCGLSKWLENNIPLELEHIDGDRNNNVRENLECLCCNCHALTDTYAGRNKKKKVTDDELLFALENSKSIREALIKVGMSPRGNNYIRVQKLLNI